MSLVLDPFPAWNDLRSGSEDTIITDLFVTRDARLASAIPQTGASLPAIHKLPTELVASIFVLCHAIESDYRRDSATNCARVILSHVCRRWRAVILSMPLLWSTISVHDASSASLPKLTAHLERSMPCPLSISVMPNPYMAEGQFKHVEDIMALVAQHAERWKSLRLYLSAAPMCVILDLLQATSFPSIETLEVGAETWNRQVSQAVFNVLSASACIRSVTWRGPGGFRGVPSGSCWEILTNININLNSVSLGDVHTLLSQCYSVVALRVSCISGDMTPNNGETITLHRLETLSICTYEPLHDLFDQLCLPKLKMLTLRYYYHISSHDRACKALDSLLARSDCTLRTLILHDDRMPSDALDQLLRMPTLDNLRDLSIELPTLTDLTLQTLTRPVDDGECVLPQLESLSLGYSTSKDGRLGDMATSRSEGGGGQFAAGQLKRLHTSVDDSRWRDRRALDALKARGLDIDY
ncbi:hypothetical protein HGRIS_000804 [Hohenbuehelia grisea]|uniref:F-box domain-containing protein n=1 Tax=Hohenbuehelia grisea TaxID=104357 RepID=A0ABR3IPS6_9AGAR